MRSRRLAALCALLLLPGLGSAFARSTGIPALLSGISGKLRVVFALPAQQEGIPGRPGVYDMPTDAAKAFRLIVLTPFSAKVDGRIGPYRLGEWPYEGRTPRDPAYEDPAGFIEVTRENFGTRVSDHFTLGQFITKGQDGVWPKYLALDRRLVDKLELTIDELARRGHAVPAACLERDVTQPHARVEALVPVFKRIYENAREFWPEYHLCEQLLDVEESFQLWRFRHMKTVERIIGFKRGTGGSSGVAFLKKALELTFFPELIDVRTEIGA